jgi:hypothetical protein
MSAMRGNQAYKEFWGWRRRRMFTSCNFVDDYHHLGGTWYCHLQPILFGWKLQV